MTKFEQIKDKYRFSYMELSKTIAELWTGSPPLPKNLMNIMKGNSGYEVLTLRKIISGINLILKKRNIYDRVTPNDCVDYDELMCRDINN